MRGGKKEKRMKSRNMVILGVLALCGVSFGALINGAQFLNKDWSDGNFQISQTTIDGGTTTNVVLANNAGTGGTKPQISVGILTVSMTNATAGGASITTGVLDPYQFHVATNYIVTTRVKVVEFGTAGFTAATSAAGFDFFDMRGMDRCWIHLEADGVWVNHANNVWEKISSITTAADTFYTWQFEINQVDGTGNGTVDIYRRTSDLDAWTTVAIGASIRDQDVFDQFGFLKVNYNATGIQQTIVDDYIQIGTAIPEPATLSLFGISAFLVLLIRRQFMK
jgi:hypothetical protein